MSLTAQIEPGSPFGNALTALAIESEMIVEIGPWLGEGSTRCLHLGMERESQRLIGVEVCQNSAAVAGALYQGDPRVEIIHGTIITADELGPREHPLPNCEDWYEGEKGLVTQAPYILDKMPSRIDLLLLDGGEWGEDVEFQKLIDRTERVALDDTNQLKSNKNWRNRLWLIENGWKIRRDCLWDRHGWMAAERP